MEAGSDESSPALPVTMEHLQTEARVEDIFHTDNLPPVAKAATTSIVPLSEETTKEARDCITIYLDDDDEEIEDGLSSDDDDDNGHKKAQKYRERYHAMVKYVRKLQKDRNVEMNRLKVSIMSQLRRVRIGMFCSIPEPRGEDTPLHSANDTRNDTAQVAVI